jgi:hypothetical protein
MKPILKYMKTACRNMVLAAMFAAVPGGFAAGPSAAAGGACSLVKADAQGYTLRLKGGNGKGRLTLNYAGNELDLSKFSHFALDAENEAQGRVEIRLRVSSEPGNPDRRIESRYFLEAGMKRELSSLMIRDYLPETSPWVPYFRKTKALPGHQAKWIYIEPGKIRQVELTVLWSGLKGGGGTVRFFPPRGMGEYVIDKMHPDELPQPLVDEAGQLVGQQWEGKLRDLSELPADGRKDLAAYSANGVLPGFSPYGGWLDGPRFEATGRFYTKKIDGKWWFVDPDGCLFWSLGVTGVGFGESTLLAGREKFFPPPGTDPDPRLWTADDRELEEGEVVFNFIYNNLKKKYGEDWVTHHATVCLGRMREWGLNTCGAWPIESVQGQQRVPYTLIIHPSQQNIGSITKVPDPFSDEFRESLREELAELGEKYSGDPWNLGIFIDNELHWCKGIRLAQEIVDLDASVPAKRGMIGFLQKKYGTVKALNKAWDSDFASFDAIRNPNGEGKGQQVFRKDMEESLNHHADTYFSMCAAAIREFLPGHLYLGCRFHGAVYGDSNPTVQRAASRHCDVLSYNIYKISAADFQAPMDTDRPWLIGEFHYGTGSHGIWGSGLMPAMDLEHQVELYEAYVNEVLQHPNFAGAHWFQWADHMTTGRYDGENYRIGFVSIVDRPYTTQAEAARNLARGMYERRAGK